MRKFFIPMFAAAVLAGSLMACGNETIPVQTGSAETSETATQETTENTEAVSLESEASQVTNPDAAVSANASFGAVPNTLAEDEEALVSDYAGIFDQLTYTDSETGLSITYNLYLPDGYNESETYPMVVFIADSSCAGADAEKSLTQGRGALVWASSEWQSVNPSIVAVPTYPETILDDHNGYSTTDYVELTKRFIDYMSQEYAVDTDRIYGTGQSMGCMTTLILASEYPDLYAACMFVDGQWDANVLSGLEGQTFVYFAAEDDVSAWNGMQDLMEAFDKDSAEYTYAQWDGTWSVDELSKAASELFDDSQSGAYFISWKAGTIDVSNSAMGGGMSNGTNRNDGENIQSSDGGDQKPETSNSNQSAESKGEKPEGMTSPQGGPGGGASYHMASFDYAYNCVAVMEWLFTN